jgi:DNA-directed RNA polymerase alpha subunit
LLKTLNSALREAALDGPVLDSVFEQWWPVLESKILGVLKKEEQQQRVVMRSDRDLLEEILSLTRAIRYDSIPIVHYTIDRLKLTERVRDRLWKGHILTIGDLVQLTENDLLKSYGLSIKSINEIKELLLEHGLHLGMKLK